MFRTQEATTSTTTASVPTPYSSGRVIRGLPHPLSRHDPISIGSDAGCDIVIDGADSVHAELRWDVETASWWVFDNPAPGATRHNGVPVEPKARLSERDWIEVAGVRIGFAAGQLKELDPDAPVGLRVTCRHVSATAGGKRRLTDISFQVVPGSFTSILGPSGGGKSTLIQRIAGLAPFEGEIRLNGHDIRTDANSILPLVAYLPQAVEDTLHGWMTVREAMADFARAHLATGYATDFGKVLKSVGLAGKIDERVSKLSGGEKRRLAFAIPLMRDPQLLLLDEPTAGLDPAMEEDIMDLLRDIADQGRTVICATHVLGCLDRCDSVLLLAPDGVPAFFGTPADALNHFCTTKWRDVYRSLQKKKFCSDLGLVPDDPEPRRLPSPVASATFYGTFDGILRRLIRAVSGSWRNLALFLGNPIGIAIVLLVACKSAFESTPGTVYFCMAVAMFWLGVSGAVRSLVSERIPRRCLDRMRGMHLVRYFTAHVAFAALSAFVQSFLFIVPLFLFKLGQKPFAIGAALPFWLILALVGVAGGCVGLFVSALSKKEIQAVWALPFVAILALFFSKPVLEGGSGEEPTGMLRVAEQIMPTLRPQLVLDTTMDWAKVGAGILREPPDLATANRENWRWFLLLAIGYPVVFLPIAFVLQNWRERQWDGR